MGAQPPRSRVPRRPLAPLLLALVAPSHGLINSSWAVNGGVTYGLNTSRWWFGTGDAGVGSWVQNGCSNAGPNGNPSCSPAYCAATNNALPACTSAALQRGNTSDATFVTLLSNIVGHTCSVAPQTQDARCTAAALSAVYSKYPGILAAYCNEEYLVVHSTVMPNHPTFLADIPTPPLGTLSDGTTCCTRQYFKSWYYAKIPLRPTPLSTALGSVNNLNNFLTGVSSSIIGSGTNDAFYTGTSPIASMIGQINIPNSGPQGWAINGVPWFNSFPGGTYTWANCEVDKCNAHVGQGFDLHYHGDPFGPQCLYSASSYANTSVHPPLVGYGADGYPIFGRHLSASAPGYSVALDECGGHVHTGIGDPYITDNSYHYHAFMLNNSVTNPTVKYAANNRATGTFTYTAFTNGPFLCFKGDISKNTNFWSPYYVPYSMGDLSSHVDFSQIQPCTSSAVYVNSAVGISINASRTSLASSGTAVSTSMTAVVGSTASGRHLLTAPAGPASVSTEVIPDVLPGIPPGFTQNFPNTVAQFLGLPNASAIAISNVQKTLNSTGFLTGLTINYVITTSSTTQSLQLIAALQLLPANSSFITALAGIFPGVTSAIVGSSVAVVGGVALPSPPPPGTAPSTSGVSTARMTTALLAASLLASGLLTA